MKKKMYRIQLFDSAPNCAEAMVLAAAKSNSGANPLTLEEIKTIGEADRLRWRPLNDRVSNIEIIGETTLHVDIRDGDCYKTALILEEVEVLEILKDYEEPLTLTA